MYQLPLAFSTGAEAEEIALNAPQSVLATLEFPMGPAVLHDATIKEDVRQCLLRLIEENATLALEEYCERCSWRTVAARGSEATVESAGAGKGDGVRIEAPPAAAGIAVGRQRRASAWTD